MEELKLADESVHLLPRKLWLRIFSYLSQPELSLCMHVCYAWNRWALSHEFWTELCISNRKIDLMVLEGIIRRQPIKLGLSHCSVTFDHIKYLLTRFPYLKHLNLQGNSKSAVSALLCGFYTSFELLDISWCEGIKDYVIFDFSTSHDAAKRRKSPFRNLKKFSLAGCDITDDTMKNITKFLPSLESLDLSYCTLITDSGVDNLTSEASLVQRYLERNCLIRVQ